MYQRQRSVSNLSKKVGCPAKIVIKEVLLFPQHEVRRYHIETKCLEMLCLYLFVKIVSILLSETFSGKYDRLQKLIYVSMYAKIFHKKEFVEHVWLAKVIRNLALLFYVSTHCAKTVK